MIFSELSKNILSFKLNHPIRIGIDGITASGKSSFARKLVETLKTSQRSVIFTSLDGFHNPRAIRHARGRESAEGYYYDAYNYPAIIENLLKPLGPKGDLLYKTQVFDLQQDQQLEANFEKADSNSILVVDGSFSLRKELRAYWNIGIYLSVDFDIAESRAAERDAALFSSAATARHVTKTRYHGAHRIHNEQAQPLENANYVILNKNPSQPVFAAQGSTF